MENEQLEKLKQRFLARKPDLLEALMRRNLRTVYSVMGVSLPEQERNVLERYFVETAKYLAENPNLDELYLTIHSPRECQKKGIASHRLWIARPRISGHPDWGIQQGIAVIEMWKEDPIFNSWEYKSRESLNYWRSPEERILPYEQARLKFDNKLIQRITGQEIQPEVIQNLGHWFCQETRLYQLKHQGEIK